MNSPLPEGSGEAAGSAAVVREHTKLARRWAHLLSATACLPLTHAELQQRLLGLVDELCDAVVSDPPTLSAGSAAGARLVELQCTGPTSLQVTMDVLGKGLLSLPGLQWVHRLAERVIGVLGSIASGYAEETRLSALDQRDALGQSVLGAMQQTLQASEARFDELVRASSSGIAMTDSRGSFLRTNEALAAILGYTAAELVQPTVFDVVHPDDVIPLQADYRALLAGKADRIHEWRRLVRKDGEIAWVSVKVSILGTVAGQRHVMVVVEDSTELHLLQGQLNRQLLHDVLTWLPNRQFFTSRLEKALRTADPATGVSLYHLDLDAFSMITGGFGWRVGDELLRTVAERLKDVVAKENAMVARFGCDEFAILVENSPRTPDVVTMVRRINEKLGQPVEIDGHRVATSATIGVVHRPAQDSAPVELLDSADLTLRRAKNNGRRQWELFDPAQDARDRAMFSLAVAMPGGWENGELQVLYQPVVRLADEGVVGVEAMLGWHHPELGQVPHDECMRLADRTGLIVPLGNWLLRSACEQVKSWQRMFGRDLPVRASLTTTQSSDPDLVGATRTILSDIGLCSDQLRLGIPLDALSTDQGEAVDNVKILAAGGVGIEIDDFGTGSMSLLRLADLPVRTVKIIPAVAERTPPRPEEDSWRERALKNLLTVIHQAGAGVTVGGVDTTEQADWWRRLGADLASGRFFASAQPPDDITALLANTRDATSHSGPSNVGNI